MSLHARSHGTRRRHQVKGSRCLCAEQSLGLEGLYWGGAELLGLGVGQRVGRTSDAIGLRFCFSAIDCGSTARSWAWNRSTTSRRVKG